jgi:hypothetical protein
MHDLPTGPALLAFARIVLLDELMPLLPAERRHDALLVGDCLAIAEREAVAGRGSAESSGGALRMLYEAETGSGSGDFDRSPNGARAPTEASALAELWRRFAGDLRVGAFEDTGPKDRRVRALLWRLTIAKLRLANPQFLDANCVAQPRGGD